MMSNRDGFGAAVIWLEDGIVLHGNIMRTVVSSYILSILPQHSSYWRRYWNEPSDCGRSTRWAAERVPLRWSPNKLAIGFSRCKIACYSKTNARILPETAAGCCGQGRT